MSGGALDPNIALPINAMSEPPLPPQLSQRVEIVQAPTPPRILLAAKKFWRGLGAIDDCLVGVALASDPVLTSELLVAGA